MALDLFSAFDPGKGGTSLPTSITLIALPALVLTGPFFTAPSTLHHTHSGLFALFAPSGSAARRPLKGFPHIVCSVFILLLLINILGAVPYAYCWSTMLIVGLPLALSFCFNLWLSAFQHCRLRFLAGLLPSGAPLPLAPLLVLVELLRLIIRPLTLSLRLLANLTAGHLFIGLIGQAVSAIFLSFSTGPLTALLIIPFYCCFELAVAFLQAYIFCLLALTYAAEHPWTCGFEKHLLVA